MGDSDQWTCVNVSVVRPRLILTCSSAGVVLLVNVMLCVLSYTNNDQCACVIILLC